MAVSKTRLELKKSYSFAKPAKGSWLDLGEAMILAEAL
jgi:hypothetical protein